MLSKRGMLKKIIGINCSINNGSSGIQVFINSKSSEVKHKIAVVGEDLFEVTEFYSGAKKGKAYYSIDHVVAISGYLIESGL